MTSKTVGFEETLDKSLTHGERSPTGPFNDEGQTNPLTETTGKP